MFKAYISMWKNTFNYKGRTNVKEYWLACICQILATVVVVGTYEGVLWFLSYNFNIILSDITAFSIPVFIFAYMVSNFSMFIRRLHDTGHSGWHILSLYGLGFVGGLIGLNVGLNVGWIEVAVAVLFLIVTIIPSEEKDNQYGPYLGNKDNQIDSDQSISTETPEPKHKIIHEPALNIPCQDIDNENKQDEKEAMTALHTENKNNQINDYRHANIETLEPNGGFNIFKAYINLWKNTFNYNGGTTKEEYCISIASQILVILTVGVFFWIWFDPYCHSLTKVGRFFIVIIFVHIFPNISMFIRRLRDSGYFDADKKSEKTQ